MAIGTGLPQRRGDTATTLVDMRSVGAGERAAAEGLAGLADGIGKLKLMLVPAAELEAVGRAGRDLEAGETRARIPLTEVDQAYNRALDAGLMSQFAQRMDGVIATLAFIEPGRLSVKEILAVAQARKIAMTGRRRVNFIQTHLKNGESIPSSITFGALLKDLEALRKEL